MYRRAPQLRPWMVPCIALELRTAVPWLLRLPSNHQLGDYVLGESLDFLHHLAQRCLDFLLQGRFLPSVPEEDRENAYLLRPRWRLFSDPFQDDPALDALAKAMPWSLVAEVPSPPREKAAKHTPLEPPSEQACYRQLRIILNEMGDALMRYLLESFRLERTRADSSESLFLEGLLSPQPFYFESQPWYPWHLNPRILSWNEKVLAQRSRTHEPRLRLKEPTGRSDWKLALVLVPLETGEPELDAAKAWQDSPLHRLAIREAIESNRWAFQHLDRFLAQAAPEPIALSQQEVIQLLESAQMDLRHSGLPLESSIQLQRVDQIRVQLDLEAPDKPLGLQSLCRFDIRVALGDQELDEKQIRQLVAAKHPLLQFQGRWMVLPQNQIQQLAEQLGSLGKNKSLSLGKALRLASGPETSVQIRGRGWLQDLLQGQRSFQLLDQPEAFRGELRDYQRRGFSWMGYLDALGLGACLADDMGLGKTIQLLALLLHERKAGAEPSPTLLVAPLSLVGNWEREARRFAPSLKILVHHGPGRGAEDLANQAPRHDLVLTTYALAARDQEHFQPIEWARIVLDEAQAIKNPNTRQSRAVKEFQAPRRAALTGTPVENRLDELWSIFDFLNPGLLGGREDFRRRFALPIERQRDTAALEQLKKLTGPFLLRRLKGDPAIQLQLPEKMEIKVYCRLGAEQAALYQATVDQLLAALKSAQGIQRKGLILATLTRLKQICNHPVLVGAPGKLDGRSGKLESLELHLEEALAEGDRSLVFTQYAEWGRKLQAHLEKKLDQEVFFLHGGTSKAKRDEMVERFQGPDGPSVFILSLKAGGVGLNLTAATQVIHYDRWWNPAVENQATDRVHRIGQTRNVQVRQFICSGTLEDRIDELLEKKKALSEAVVGTGEAWLTELDEASLRELLRLDRDAWEEG